MLSSLQAQSYNKYSEHTSLEAEIYEIYVFWHQVFVHSEGDFVLFGGFCNRHDNSTLQGQVRSRSVPGPLGAPYPPRYLTIT